MIIYTIIMLVSALGFGLVSVLIYKGKTELIHDYHQQQVKDKGNYARSFGKAMGILSVTMALSGVIALFGLAAMGLAIGVLILGLMVGVIAIVLVQKKYNGGVF